MEGGFKKETTLYTLPKLLRTRLWILAVLTIISMVAISIVSYVGIASSGDLTHVFTYGILTLNIFSLFLFIDGLFAKNLIQIYYVTLVVTVEVVYLVLFTTIIVDTAYIPVYAGVCVLVLVRSAYVIYLCSALYSEFGWVQFKMFGGSRTFARILLLRKTLKALKKVTLMRLVAVVAIRLSVINERTWPNETLIALLLISLLLYFMGPDTEDRVLRICDIGCTGTVAGVALKDIITYADSTISNPYVTNIVDLILLIETCMSFPIYIFLVLFMAADFFYFGSGYKSVGVASGRKRLAMC